MLLRTIVYKELKTHLLARGYEESLIDLQILRVSQSPREEVLRSIIAKNTSRESH